MRVSWSRAGEQLVGLERLVEVRGGRPALPLPPLLRLLRLPGPDGPDEALPAFSLFPSLFLSSNSSVPGAEGREADLVRRLRSLIKVHEPEKLDLIVSGGHDVWSAELKPDLNSGYNFWQIFLIFQINVGRARSCDSDERFDWIRILRNRRDCPFSSYSPLTQMWTASSHGHKPSLLPTKLIYANLSD